MADSQGPPAASVPVPPAEASGSANAGPSSSSSGSSSPRSSSTYWCYQCRKYVNVQVDRSASQEGPSSGMVCVECRSGFVEIADSAPAARAAVGVSRRGDFVLGRRRRRRGNALTHTVTLSDALEQLYPQQLVQVLQQLRDDATQQQHPTRVNGYTEEDGEVAAAQGRVLLVDGELAAGHEGEQEQDEDDDDSDSDSEPEEHVLTAWNAQDDDHEDDDEDEDGEDEWEEVVDGEDAAAAGGEDADADADADAEESEDAGENDNQQVEELPELEHRNARARRDPRRPRNFQRYLQELLQNLVGQNIEVRVEVPEYVGNPGDYVDARGFDLLLQQLAENDNSRRGAPPAARSAIKRLISIHIQQQHLDDGSALCAVCKDTMCLGELAKQLPCLHLYHEECILPWLDARNSCPLCRFELPTDDPDYEEHKRRIRQQQQRSVDIAETSEVEEQEQPRQQEQEGPQQQQQQQQEASSSQEHAEVAAHQQLQQERPSAPTGRRRGSAGRGWFFLSAAAGPVISMVGLVLVIYLMGTSSAGGGAAQVARQREGMRACLDQQQQQQQHQNPQQQQLVSSASDSSHGSSSSSRRRWWWLPFQR